MADELRQKRREKYIEFSKLKNSIKKRIAFYELNIIDLQIKIGKLKINEK